MIQMIRRANLYLDQAKQRVRQGQQPEDLLLAAVNYQEAGHYFRKIHRWNAARETYLAAAENFQKGGLFNQAHEARTWANQTKPSVHQWFSQPLQIGCLGTSTILAYGLVYWLLDGVINDSTYYQASSFWEALAFSGVTFATLGYGNLYPKTPLITLLAVSEAFLGIIALSLLIVSFTTRKLNPQK